jgi:hypothetical protein
MLNFPVVNDKGIRQPADMGTEKIGTRDSFKRIVSFSILLGPALSV